MLGSIRQRIIYGMILGEKNAMTAKVKIKDRIASAIIDHGGGGSLVYHRLARYVFPEDEYPNSWGSPARGGPPGCYMALSRAIHKHGFHMDLSGARAVCYSKISLGNSEVTAIPPMSRSHTAITNGVTEVG